MKILITNDDGYFAPGIYRLAAMARQLGDVCIVAPEFHCSAKSHSITLRAEMELRQQDIGLAGVRTWSLAGTPADCVRVALNKVLPFCPDIVFSGINEGANAGFDIAYSATTAAAFEAAFHGIPAIAFSRRGGGLDEIADAYLKPLAEILSGMPPGRGEIWNVNFPGIPLAECKGVLWNRGVADTGFYIDRYDARTEEDGRLFVYEVPEAAPAERFGRCSDIRAIAEGYVSVGKVKSHVL